MSERPVHELIKELSQVLVILSDKVEGNLLAALYAVKNQDEEGARKIRMVDDEIDMAEVNLEERCLAFLATQQPVARDLRTIVTIIKINDDLERIGDLAVHIIERMPDISPEIIELFAFESMGMLAGEMVEDPAIKDSIQGAMEDAHMIFEGIGVAIVILLGNYLKKKNSVKA